MRKAVEHLSFSLGGWLHVADTFASSKDAHRQPQYVSECLGGMWKTPVLPLKRFPPPSQRLYDISLSFICQAVASKKVNCKHVAWTGCTESSCCVRCLLCTKTKKDAAGNTKSGAITQQQIWQEQCLALFELQDSFTQCLFQWAWTMQAECALCCRAGDCSSELGVNYKRGLCKLDVMAS